MKLRFLDFWALLKGTVKPFYSDLLMTDAWRQHLRQEYIPRRSLSHQGGTSHVARPLKTYIRKYIKLFAQKWRGVTCRSHMAHGTCYVPRHLCVNGFSYFLAFAFKWPSSCDVPPWDESGLSRHNEKWYWVTIDIAVFCHERCNIRKKILLYAIKSTAVPVTQLL